ncbi:MAG: heavy-metal-associated domain-containing protein [Flammeovirgaceae bacterium]|nr:MAG: heavy-metal-associated domain-containing protein [Flammeovirgaceae bacterium]
MSTLKFKTNIKCSSCVATVKPVLNTLAGEGKWHVDLAAPERTLTVETEATDNQISEALLKVGYKAEVITNC